LGWLHPVMHSVRFWLPIHILRKKTSVRHWRMPHGASKKSKCRCRPREVPDRYKPESGAGLVSGQQGLEAVHWSTVGDPQASDLEIFDFASANGWIVFTHDLDFGILLATLRTTAPSVIQVRSQDVLPSAIGELVLRAIQTGEPYFGAGALVIVDPARHRIRLLPI
jgi:predicted nuclease of predicted toxin-antitoxin system